MASLPADYQANATWIMPAKVFYSEVMAIADHNSFVNVNDGFSFRLFGKPVVVDDNCKVDACGFGAVLVRTSAMAKISQKKGLPFNPIQGFGEDLSFCLKAKECGFDIWCDRLGQTMTLFEKTKAALRISTNALDTEIADNIETAKEELIRAGVSADAVSEEGSLVTRAVTNIRSYGDGT
ncbi:unnamed protein product [Cylicocyclus nassatus]|uniref:Uncharacterized protein n=1 Tax=Cylicocyclus nassatus TaxID=53992 RepID=A0AA36GQM8_CYLNA|nr:unnamed protein product [Cylicocyclus nassatus]